MPILQKIVYRVRADRGDGPEVITVGVDAGTAQAELSQIVSNLPAEWSSVTEIQRIGELYVVHAVSVG